MDLITYALSKKNGSFSGDYNDLTNKPILATVAISGDYNDLSNLPTVPLSGDYVTAGQKDGTTLGTRATAEGYNTTASDIYTHAEGTATEATGPFTHAEGANTKATNSAAHAEGRYTEATQTAAHAEGDYSVAKAIYSHAEGTHTKAYGVQSHAEGHYNIALGNSAHAEGYSEDRIGNFFITKSITPGWYTVSSWPENEELYSRYNIVYIMYNNTQYYGYIDQVDVEGLSLRIYLPNFSHWSDLPAEAIKLYVIGAGAFGDYSHSEGYNTKALGETAHAEGEDTMAEGPSSHAEGTKTMTGGFSAHAEGEFTQAMGHYSHSEGYYTIANHKSQHVFGEYNEADTSIIGRDGRGDYVEIVGNGISENNRSNARTLDWAGNEVLKGTLTVSSNGITIGNTTITEAQLQALLNLLSDNIFTVQSEQE